MPSVHCNNQVVISLLNTVATRDMALSYRPGVLFIIVSNGEIKLRTIHIIGKSGCKRTLVPQPQFTVIEAKAILIFSGSLKF